MNVECAAFHEETFNQRPDDYGPKLRSTIESGMLVPGVKYLQAQRLRRRFHQDMQELAGKVDILLTPSTPTPAPRDLTTTGDPMFQSPWTFAGLPTVSLPSGLSRSGLPLGIQIAGRMFGEESLLAMARWCEAALDVVLEPPEPD